MNEIIIKGAREHNLKNVDLTIPRDKLVVFTGLSGSGKSSLAFDTIYADGQRRYVESLSSYARMFLGQMEKPDVDSIEGPFRPLFRSTRKPPAKTPVRLSERSPRFMTICGFYTRGSAFPIVRSADGRSSSSRSIRWSIRSFPIPNAPAFRS